MTVDLNSLLNLLNASSLAIEGCITPFETRLEAFERRLRSTVTESVTIEVSERSTQRQITRFGLYFVISDAKLSTNRCNY